MTEFGAGRPEAPPPGRPRRSAMRRMLERLKSECSVDGPPPGPPLPAGRARVAKLLGSFFGAGFLPLAPGTWGSLVALVIYVLAMDFAPLEPELFGSLGCLLLFLTFAIASLALGGEAQRAAAHKDPAWFVLDEMAGVFLALFALAPYNFAFAGLAFLIFRLFDASKIGAVGWMDRRLSGTVGILLDDCVAGASANLLVRGLAFVLAALGVVPVRG